MEQLSLYELNAHVRSLIEGGADSAYWVHGEMLEGRVGSGGHFYGELIEKSETTGNVVARARITIWSRLYSKLYYRFKEETGQNLRPGIKILVQVKVAFHEVYGYSLNVLDIDGSYTLGDMARQRMEILKQLEKDGIKDDNKALPLPLLLKRIAVISSATAAGYGDFCRQLQENDYGLAFKIDLFPAVMQGQHVPESVMAALSVVASQSGTWDAVVIIRGGGATCDLSDFDSYPLAACIAQYPLPVIVGIGHDRDETVLDYIAHTAVKTPTAAASFIVDHQLAQLTRLRDCQQRIPIAVNALLQNHTASLSLLRQRLPSTASLRVQKEKQRLERAAMLLPMRAKDMVVQRRHNLEQLALILPVRAKALLEARQHRLELLTHRLQALDPEILLQRGYSLTLLNGRILTDISGITPGMQITVCLKGGEILSEVKDVTPK